MCDMGVPVINAHSGATINFGSYTELFCKMKKMLPEHVVTSVFIQVKLRESWEYITPEALIVLLTVQWNCDIPLPLYYSAWYESVVSLSAQPDIHNVGKVLLQRSNWALTAMKLPRGKRLQFECEHGLYLRSIWWLKPTFWHQVSWLVFNKSKGPTNLLEIADVCLIKLVIVVEASHITEERKMR